MGFGNVALRIAVRFCERSEGGNEGSGDEIVGGNSVVAEGFLAQDAGAEPRR